MESFDLLASFFTILAVLAGLFAWFVGPLALTMILVYIYTGDALLGVFLGIIVEVIAIVIGFEIIDVM